ncbi:MAG: hypothetical protein IID43_02065 [Planctomycetes bacterium]|nr:hypothetical protein [Planctomycetota bacterium]
MHRSSRHSCGLVSVSMALATLGSWVGVVHAEEVTVQNDSLVEGSDGAIQAGFAANESAASWLSSPCDGTLVAVQVFWRSVSGGIEPSLEASINIFDGGSFPVPGFELELLEGPVMTDGVLNEFRFLDENQTIPLSVPLANGQVFIVSFRFANAPDPFNGPSVITDTDGCQTGKNAINENTFGWIDSCILGVSGDFVIRAVVECGALPGACCQVGGGCDNGLVDACTGGGGVFQGEGSDCGSVVCQEACCFQPSGCLDFTVADCATAGGFNQGPGTDCAGVTCFPSGACCNTDGTCDDDVLETDCTAAGGSFGGDGVLCADVTCVQPQGACCLSGGGCLLLAQDDCNVIPNSVWAGAETDCTDDDSNGTADACEQSGPNRPEPEDFLGVRTCQSDDDCVNESYCVSSATGSFPGVCYVPKNRYVSVDPNPLNIAPTARRVSVVTGVGTSVVLGWFGVPDSEGVCRVVSEADRHYTIWKNEFFPIECSDDRHCPPGDTCDMGSLSCLGNTTSTVHLGDCHIGPKIRDPGLGETKEANSYLIEAVLVGTDIADPLSYSPALELRTVVAWGDQMGSTENGSALPPDGTPGFIDILGQVQVFKDRGTAPTPWFDLEPEVPDGSVGFLDMATAVLGFKDRPYPWRDPCECAGLAPCN